jgi:hypothetical protein
MKSIFDERCLWIWRRDAEGNIWLANAFYDIPEWHLWLTYFPEPLTEGEAIAFSGGWHAC